jgi:flavin reductase (DIM6/NTAB) family NADH-FMN oxidoreductase RutF
MRSAASGPASPWSPPSTPPDDHLADIEWEAAEGAPVLRDAMAVFACAKEAEHDGGDHIIVVGRVLRLDFRPEQDPLLYFQGRYRSVHVPE